jgi:hypothetical protein
MSIPSVAAKRRAPPEPAAMPAGQRSSYPLDPGLY